MQSLLVKPYSIDNNPSHTKSNTKTTINSISALTRVSTSVSALKRVKKHVHVPNSILPDYESFEHGPFPHY